MDEIADRVARDKTNATRERAGNKDDELLWTGTDEAQRYQN
jgi:hypothetical protein